MNRTSVYEKIIKEVTTSPPRALCTKKKYTAKRFVYKRVIYYDQYSRTRAAKTARIHDDFRRKTTDVSDVRRDEDNTKRMRRRANEVMIRKTLRDEVKIR